MSPGERDALESRIAASIAASRFAEAATEALRGFGPELLGYLIGTCGNDDLGHDAFAELCERMWKGLPQFRGECSFRAWCYRIARSVCLDQKKRAHRHRERPALSHEISAVAMNVASTRPTYLRSEIRDRFADVRAALDDDEQALLVLRLDRNLSWPEIAAIFAEGAPIDPATLRKRFERIKRRLRDVLLREGPSRER
jgi:RNA polymerase sigma-70 factor (ECF subfamily)